MKIDKVPVLGKINQTINVLMINFMFLAIISLILGLLIPFYPKVLDVLVAALLIVSAAILLNIAYNIHLFKKKYMKWFD